MSDVPQWCTRVTIVLLTYNCAPWIRRTLHHLESTGCPLVAVDNGSTDATLDALREHPNLRCVELPHNLGAAARNAGVEQATTPYVAFADDDTWWRAESLATAVELLDAHPGLALVNAHILVGEAEKDDPTCLEMAASPLKSDDGLPGSVIMSFMAGAVVMRRSVFLSLGGYDERFFMGGEEEELAWRIAMAGWEMRYVPSVVTHHYPSLQNAAAMRALGIRNTIWNSWLHRPWSRSLWWTWYVLRSAPKDRVFARALRMLLPGMLWVPFEREVVPPHIEARLLELERHRATTSSAREYGTPRRWSSGGALSKDRATSGHGDPRA
jgi:GT2 family glycosyltransferase